MTENPEQTEEKSQIQSQEGNQEEQKQVDTQEVKETKYEVKILKQIRYLPYVFMLKTKYGEVEKISLISDHFVDCTKYTSRSELTFEGCVELRNEKLREVRGIYYTPIASVISVYSRKKISRDIESMKSFIMATLENHGLTNSKLLISYDNYSIEIYDEYSKGQLLEFDQVAEQGHLEIYNSPPPKHIRPDEFETVRNIQIYNHTLETNVDIKLYRLYATPGLVYLLYIPEHVIVRISSPDHKEKLVDLYSGQYYLIAHPAPRKTID